MREPRVAERTHVCSRAGIFNCLFLCFVGSVASIATAALSFRDLKLPGELAREPLVEGRWK
jgi:hypothetical protein